jgi:hypothetical protein
MIPSADDRLSSMLRAMQEVILPALPAQESLAVEQAHLLLGHIALLREQLDRLSQYEQVEAASLVDLASKLVERAQGGAQTMAQVGALEAVLARQVPQEPCARRAFTEALSIAIEGLIEASGEDGSAAFLAVSTACVLNCGNSISQRDRSWFKSTGFERADVALAPFDSWLKPARVDHEPKD